MTYHNRLVACIKVDGKILREIGDTVSIPFGSEYSVYIKNLNSVRVQCKVHVDGTDATEGTWLVIAPNSTIELERYIRNGNMEKGNRFKFIPRTKGIEKHRGLQADDGLVRIEYKTERVVKTEDIHVTRHFYNGYYPPWTVYQWYPRWWGDTYVLGGVHYVNTTGAHGQTSYTTSGSLPQSSSFMGASFNAASDAVNAKTVNAMTTGVLRNAKLTTSAAPVDDSGITVPGSESSQKFSASSYFQVHDQSEVIVLKLRGEIAGKKVVKAVTVKTKPKCSTCGKVNKGTSKFCVECGTSLVLV